MCKLRHERTVNRGRDVSSPAIWATKIPAHFGDNNVAQMTRRLNGQICSHTPSALNAGAKRSDVPYGHASLLLLGEGSDATEPYNKYRNLFKYMFVDQFDQPIWSTLLSPM